MLALRDPSKRPRDPIPAGAPAGSPLSWMGTVSHGTFDVQSVELQGGPSGMTADHLRPILVSEAETSQG